MNARQQKVLERFGQVLTFLDANQSSIPPTSVASQRQTLETAVTQITAFAQDQLLKGQESILAHNKSSRRVALRDTYMRQLSAVGLHSLTGKNAGDPNVPNAKLIFKLPATRTDSSVLVQSAEAMVKAATPFVSIFTANGVSLDAVSGAIQALKAAVTADDSAKRVSQGATAGIKAQIAAGHGAVALMDVVVRPLVAPSKSLVAQWAAVKRAAGGHNLKAPTAVPGATPVVSTPGGTPASNSGSTPVSTTAPAPSASAPAAATGGTQQQQPAATQPSSQPAASAPATPGV